MRNGVHGFFRNIICWLFGECWQAVKMREDGEDLLQRVESLERQVQAEKARSDWRPGDVFRVR